MGVALCHPWGLGHDPRGGYGHRWVHRLGYRGGSAWVGLLIAEGELPVRLRCFYLSDADLDMLAARASQLRADSATVIDLDSKRKGA